jgi:hypothetical protein
VTISCSNVNRLKEAYVDGLLRPEVRAAIESHVMGCDLCQRRVFLARRVKVGMKDALTLALENKLPAASEGRRTAMAVMQARLEERILGTPRPQRRGYFSLSLPVLTLLLAATIVSGVIQLGFIKKALNPSLIIVPVPTPVMPIASTSVPNAEAGATVTTQPAEIPTLPTTTQTGQNAQTYPTQAQTPGADSSQQAAHPPTSPRSNKGLPAAATVTATASKRSTPIQGNAQPPINGLDKPANEKAPLPTLPSSEGPRDPLAGIAPAATDTPPQVLTILKTPPSLAGQPATETNTATPADSAPPSGTPDPAQVPTESIPTSVPTEPATRTNTPVATQTGAPTQTATQTPTHTPTQTPTYVPSQVPPHTSTPPPTHTAEPSNTSIPTRTATETSTETAMPTSTSTCTPTLTSTVMPTLTATSTPTVTAIPPQATANPSCTPGLPHETPVPPPSRGSPPPSGTPNPSCTPEPPHGTPPP